METKIIISLGLICLISLVTAGGLLLSTWNDNIDLTTEQVNQIKTSSNISEIDVTISPITCDNKNCWATAKQENVINSRWTNPKAYCSKYSVCEEDEKEETIPLNESCTIECLEWTDYTLLELTELVNQFVENKLSNWADAEIERKNRGIPEAKSDVGKIGVIEK